MMLGKTMAMMVVVMIITLVVVVFDGLFPFQERIYFRFLCVKDMKYLTFAFLGLVNGPV